MTSKAEPNDWRRYLSREERAWLKHYEALKRNLRDMTGERQRIQMRAAARARRKVER